MTDPELKQRFMLLNGIVALVTALLIAVLGVVLNMAFQVGQINGQLAVLIGHVALK